MLQILPVLSYYGKTNRGGGSGKINPLTQIRAKGVTDTMTAEKGVTDTHRHLQLGILDTRNSKWYNKEWLRI